MYPQSRTIRGLSIATIILSSIGVFFGLLFVILAFGYTAALNDPATANQIAHQLLSSNSAGSTAFDGNSAYSYSYSDMTADEAMVVVSSTGPLFIIMAFGYLICRGIGLLAAILAFRNFANPAKLGAAFGWSIAAAVLQVFAGMIVSAVLFVITAVFISKLRNAWKTGAFTNGDSSQDGMPQPPIAQ